MLIKNYFSALQLHWYWATTKKFKPQEAFPGHGCFNKNPKGKLWPSCSICFENLQWGYNYTNLS